MAGPVILVTGANRGIGFSIAQALGQENPGITLLVASRSITTAEEAIKQLRLRNVTAAFRPIELDVTNDDSVQKVVSDIGQRFGHLDVLINNAGIAVVPKPGLTDYRSTFNSTMDTNVTSVGFLTTSCIPLLRASQDPRVINVSSARASVHALTTGTLPPTKVVSYVVSKVGLNVLTLEMRKLFPDVLFQCASPGHCATGLNGFTGQRDPLDGAQVVVRLALGERNAYPGGFWECVDEKMREVAW